MERKKYFSQNVKHVTSMRDVEETKGGFIQQWQHLDEENKNHTSRYFNYSMSNLWFGIKDDLNLHVGFQL